MKIYSSGYLHDNDPLQNKTGPSSVNRQQTEGSAPNAAKNRKTGERIEISGKAREIHQISGIIRNTPDIRTERVTELKQMVRSGTYAVQTEQVAGKILDEIQKGVLGF